MESKYRKYSIEEKETLADLVEKYKEEYDKELEENQKKNKVWNKNKRAFVTKGMSWGYLSRAVRTAYPSLANVSASDEKFQAAVKVATRAFENRKRKVEGGEENVSGLKKKYRESGGGRKAQAVEVRQAMFE